MTDTPNKIEEIRAALEGATPGPWAHQMGDIAAEGCDGDDIVIAGMNKSCGARSSVYSTYKPKNPTAQANARLMALAPDMARMVLEQADRIAQLEARAEAAEADRARLARLLVEALSEIKEQTSSAET